MGHLARSRAKDRSTPREWLPLGSQIASQCNSWAGRNDIVAFVGEGAGGGMATACWIPALAEMEVNVDVAFGEGVKPQWVTDFTERATHFEHPAAAGATLHEAMHARHTLFALEDLHGAKESPAVRAVAEYLEESRVEARGVQHFPKNRSFLRACALKIVLSDLNMDDVKAQGVFGISTLLLLTLARVDAGVLDPEDVFEIRQMAADVFGEELLGKLRSVWLRGQSWNIDTDVTGLLELGKEWVQLLLDSDAMTEEQANAPEMRIVMVGPGGEPLTGEDGEPITIPAEILAAIEQMMEAMEEAAEVTEIEARGEAANQQQKEAWAEMAGAKAEVSKEIKAGKDAADQLFAKGTGPSPNEATSSRLREKRPPKAQERAAAVKIGQMLDKARYQDRVVTPVKSAIPPGRLNTRAAVQGVADIRRIGMTSQTPWHAVKRHHVEDPELDLGVIVDISGSMGGAMEPMAVTAWIFAEAARRIDARCAMAYYGNSVFPVLRPGQRMPEVNVYSAPDSTERFSKAAKAINGALNLKYGSGARLLVIVSDMCYTADEQVAAKRWCKELLAAGVAVVIMPFENSSYYTSDYAELGCTIVAGALNPAKAALEIGKACVGAIEKVSARRAVG